MQCGRGTHTCVAERFGTGKITTGVGRGKFTTCTREEQRNTSYTRSRSTCYSSSSVVALPNRSETTSFRVCGDACLRLVGDERQREWLAIRTFRFVEPLSCGSFFSTRMCEAQKQESYSTITHARPVYMVILCTPPLCKTHKQTTLWYMRLAIINPFIRGLLLL